MGLSSFLLRLFSISSRKHYSFCEKTHRSEYVLVLGFLSDSLVLALLLGLWFIFLDPYEDCFQFHLGNIIPPVRRHIGLDMYLFLVSFQIHWFQYYHLDSVAWVYLPPSRLNFILGNIIPSLKRDIGLDMCLFLVSVSDSLVLALSLGLCCISLSSSLCRLFSISSRKHYSFCEKTHSTGYVLVSGFITDSLVLAQIMAPRKRRMRR
jgi:hypothetical protein